MSKSGEIRLTTDPPCAKAEEVITLQKAALVIMLLSFRYFTLVGAARFAALSFFPARAFRSFIMFSSRIILQSFDPMTPGLLRTIWDEADGD